MKIIIAFFCIILLFCSSFKPAADDDIYSPSGGVVTYSGNVLSQQDVVEKVLNKLKVLNQYYETNRNYEVDITHVLFSSVDASTVEEKFSGFYKSHDGMEHSLLLGIETIQNRDVRVSIDTNSQTISISDIQESIPFSIAELERSLKFCKNVKLSENDGLDIISLEFDINKYPLYKLDISISKSRIASIDMYHAEKTDNNKGEKVYPHTKVEYTNYIENVKKKKKHFDVSVIVVRSEDTYKPTNAYKDYKIYDLRVKK